MIVRVAVGLARNPTPEHRWRRVAVLVSATVFMLLILAAASVVVMMHRESERVEQRTALLASEPSPTDLDLAYGDDVWRGEQYLAVWMEPAGEKRPILPPGMDQLPEPGQAVVSPALDREAASNPDLAKRYPNRLVLDSVGVRSEDELFAYIRVPEDRTISGDLVKELSGDTEAVRVRAFGLPTGNSTSYGLDPLSPTPTVSQTVAGVVGFLIVPGLIVLTVGLAAASVVRERRFEVLRWIGASRRTLAALAILETMLLAVPGLVAATIFWTIISPSLERVPFVGHTAVRGDLELPWWLLLAGLGAGVAVTALVAIMVTTGTSILRRAETARPRPASERVSLTLLRAAPLSIAFLLLALGWLIRGPIGGIFNLGGIVAMIAGVPFVFPNVLRATGIMLGKLKSVPASIAGRGLEWDPLRAARPFLGVAALLIVTLAGSGYIALAGQVGTSSLPTEGTQPAVIIEWLDPQPDDFIRLSNAIGAGLVVPFGEGAHEHENGRTHEHSNGDALVIGAKCSQLAPYFPGTSCSSEAPYRLAEDMERKLTETMAPAAHSPDTEVRLAPAQDIAMDGRALAIDNAPLETLEGRVRGAAMRLLPAPYVYSWLSSLGQASPLVSWIAGGIVAAAIALTLGCLTSLIDRLLGTHRHRRHLLNLGVSPRRLAAIEAWLFAAPYGSVAAISFCAGLMVCVLIVGIFPEDITMPWRGVIITLGIALVVGLAGTMSMALFGAKSVRENPE